MRSEHMASGLQELLTYPERCFGEPALQKWVYLCSSMTTYPAPSLNFPIEKGRKWELVSALQKATVHAANTPLYEWQKKSNWRTEGLLIFVGLELPLEKEVRSEPVPHCRTIFELPNYCYDIHTRIGLAVLKRLVHGVPGAH